MQCQCNHVIIILILLQSFFYECILYKNIIKALIFNFNAADDNLIKFKLYKIQQIIHELNHFH